MDEESLKNSIELYKSQLNQVEQAIEAAGETDDMVKLKDDLKELIALTEDSLLSLLKGQLLQSIESTSTTTTTTTTIDDEYAAFQEALGEDTTKNDSTNHDTDNTIPGEDNSIDESLEESLLELQGMRCRAPFQHDWGCLAYYNALIHSVDPVSHNTQCPMVNVMFCNPTHSSMALCPFYLEGRCKFSDEECRNSHGYPVKIEDLQEYQEPNYSLVKIDTKCLAQYEDGLWYKATVIDMKDQKIQVLFDEYGDKTSIGLERILPIDNGDDISDEESELDDDLNKPLDRSDSEDDDALPVFLWKPPKTTAKLGEWEEHTKGIGSKLMIKMGYIIGQGLGKNGDGKAEPVPIQLIPKGKSLDKIMELKEIAGDQDLFDAMKKLKKKTKKTEDKNRQPKQTSQPTDMFDFINKKLRGKKGNLHDLVIKHPVPGTSHGNHSKKNITEKDLQSKSDRHLNIQLLKTDEELKSVDKELKSLKQSLARNQLRDKAAAKRIEAKIASLVEYQHNLRTSERTMSQHKQRRKDHKKLTIF